jgi:hypothetical protein
MAESAGSDDSITWQNGWQVVPGSLELEVDGQAFARTARPLRLGPVDGVIAAAPGSWTEGANLDVKLLSTLSDLPPLSACVADVQEHNGEALYRFAWQVGSLAEAKPLLAYLDRLCRVGDLLPAPGLDPMTELLSGPARVIPVLREVMLSGSGCRVLSPTRTPVEGLTLRLAEVDSEKETLVWRVSGKLPPFPLRVELPGYLSLFRCVFEEGDQQDTSLRTRIPLRIARLRHRRFARTPSQEHAQVKLLHPVWPELSIIGSLRNVSFRGLSFATHASPHGLFPGLTLPEFQVRWGDGREVGLSGSVRHVWMAQDESLCGIDLEFRSSQQRRAWFDASAAILFPNTSGAAGREAKVWEVFAESGYFSIGGKGEQTFDQAQNAFRTAVTRLAAAPHLGCHVVWPSKRGVDCVMTTLKAYTGTWTAYQLARRKELGDQAVAPETQLREIVLHGYHFACNDPGLAWFIAWIPDQVRFTWRLVGELAGRQNGTCGDVTVLPFRVYQIQTDQGSTPPDSEVDVREATADEIDLLVARLADSWPSAYLESHDLVGGRVSLERLTNEWRAAGLRRARHVLVARRGGAILAAAVLELAEDGLHLYGLFDVMRVYALDGTVDESLPSLIAAATEWYRSQGKTRFVYFSEQSNEPRSQLGAFRDLGPARLVVLAASLMPEQLDQAFEVTAPRTGSSTQARSST